MNSLLTILICALVPMSVSAGITPGNKIEKIKIKTSVITVEIADDDKSREIGLMNRTSMPLDHGMLFVFTEARPLGFWMKNTKIPLSIGFFDASKTLVDIQEMSVEPATTPDPQRKQYISKGPALYALELNKGWFKKHGLNVGDKFDFVKK